ncbi:MAG TPA: hypothetical protein VKE51_25155 [Vicinamibacterales bacterium]|nr:hypothetical protein [Vicinamibacterales bacterium]
MFHAIVIALTVLASSASSAAQLARAAGDPLQARVTISFRDAAAADVIRSLAAGAGVKVEIAAGALRPVTITLTNVKLGTALDAVCDNALCSWRLLVGDSLKITPLPSEGSAMLPRTVSFSIEETPPTEVFRALAAAIGVPVTIEAGLPAGPVSLNFKSTPTQEVLNILCNAMQCAWDFDPQRGLRVMAKR